MHKLLFGGLGLMVLVGCGLNQEKFGEKFVDQYCGVYDTCNTSGTACPVNDENAVSASDCAFDKGLAKDCLDADYTCDDTIPGFEVVVTPEACLDVCGQSTTAE